MSVIYIFSREPSNQKMVKIDVCEDYVSELEKLNEQLRSVGDTTSHFEAFATFDLTNNPNLTSQKLKNVLHAILSKSKYDKLADTYYAISKEDAYNKIYALFDFNSTDADSSLIGGESNQIVSKTKSAPKKKNQTKASSKSKKPVNGTYHPKYKDDKERAVAFLLEKCTDDVYGAHNIHTKLNETKNITYASLTNGTQYYWANPQVYCLGYDWYLIIDDVPNKKYHLFFVPAGKYSEDQFKTRIKRSALCLQLQIGYDDPNFTDGPSKISFFPYKIFEVDYSGAIFSDDVANLTTKLTNVASVDTAFRNIGSYSYKGKTYSVRSVKDMLRNVLNLIYSEKSEVLYSLASSHYSPFQGEKEYLTCNLSVKNRYHSPYEILTSGIYCETCLNHDQSFVFISNILDRCGYDTDDFVVCFRAKS